MHLAQPSVDFPELEAFLASGSPPLYAGFGSMPKHDQARNASLIVEAARSLGQRVIIANFWDPPSDIPNSDDIFFIRHHPHLDLFPRTAAVIHHGGAGTTATSAVSGAPQIIVPHALDQYYWGHQIHKSGLGPKPIPRDHLTSRRLAEAIRECHGNNQMQAKARAVQKTIMKHNSLEMAVRELLKGVSRAATI
jgi:UDP:flavonoid glycosyltransferase YjiC (YdhE family)